jgi:hypothetical protein
LKYTFAGTADVQSQSGPISRLIIEDKQGDQFFLTDQAYIGPNDAQLTRVDTNDCYSWLFLRRHADRTPAGEVGVQSLKRGDQVLTADGRTVTVDWLGIQTISLRFADKLRVLPIRIQARALRTKFPRATCSAKELLRNPLT